MNNNKYFRSNIYTARKLKKDKFGNNTFLVLNCYIWSLYDLDKTLGV